MDPYDLLMAQIAQNQSTLLRPGVRPGSALGDYGTQMLQSLGFGQEAINQMDPNSWASRFGSMIGLDKAGVNNLESNIAGMNFDIPGMLAGLKSSSEGISSGIGGALNEFDSAYALAARDLVGRSKDVNSMLSASPSAQAFMSLSPFEPLAPGTGILDAMNTGTPWQSLVVEDRNAVPPPLPPSLEAIVREANQGQPGSSDPAALSHTFSLGTLPPADLFRLPNAGGSGIGMADYQRIADQLPQAERIVRETAAPTDFSAADAAMAAARPEYEAGGPWGQVLQGIARGALGSMDGDIAQILFAAGMGGLGGLGSGMDIEKEREDLARERERVYNMNKANYEIDKSGTRRAEQQQGFDAAYESDVNFNQQQAQRQQDVVNLMVHGLDTEAAERRSVSNSAMQVALANQENALKLWEMSQPDVKFNQYGLSVTKTDDKGNRTVTFDNSPWVQRMQMQAQMRQMGALGMLPGGDMPGLDFGGGAGPVSAEDLVKKLSTAYVSDPSLAAADLTDPSTGKGLLSDVMMKINGIYGDSLKGNEVLQMTGNGLFSELSAILNNPTHPLNAAVRARLAQMTGMQ